jgi:hypothetical protein
VNIENGTFYCLDVGNGPLERWNFTPTPHQYILSSPIMGASNVVFCSDNGILYSGGQPPQPKLDFSVHIPKSIIQGTDAKIGVDLVNVGDIAANNVSMTVHVDSLMVWDDWILDPVNITGLDPGQSISVTFNLTLTAGTHRVDIDVGGGYPVNGSVKGGLIEVKKSKVTVACPGELLLVAIVLILITIPIILLIMRKPIRKEGRGDEEE